jgi:hypothetical protein
VRSIKATTIGHDVHEDKYNRFKYRIPSIMASQQRKQRKQTKQTPANRAQRSTHTSPSSRIRKPSATQFGRNFGWAGPATISDPRQLSDTIRSIEDNDDESVFEYVDQVQDELEVWLRRLKALRGHCGRKASRKVDTMAAAVEAAFIDFASPEENQSVDLVQELGVWLSRAKALRSQSNRNVSEVDIMVAAVETAFLDLASCSMDDDESTLTTVRTKIE